MEMIIVSMQKNANWFFSIFPWKLWKKSCRNEFKFWEASRNHISSFIILSWKMPKLLASISEKVVPFIYRISSYNCRGNYSFLEVGVRQLFKGGNYSKEETINVSIFCMHKYIVHAIVKMKNNQVNWFFYRLSSFNPVFWA